MLQTIIQHFSASLTMTGWQQEKGKLIIQITSVASKTLCPSCRSPSTRVHSRYTRRIADLPWSGNQVELRWQVRRFFCVNATCPKRTFSEQITKISARYARKTNRLLELQRQIGYELGGEPGKRIALIVRAPVSGDSLLNFVKKDSERPTAPPRFIGIDDWAMKKGQKYGTILVDLESRKPIDLLPDREADTVATWLKRHPGVELVSRDRSLVYSKGITAGAPNAIQVADRFHLLCNLQNAVQRMFEQRSSELREAEKNMLGMLTRAVQAGESGESDSYPDNLILPTPQTWKQTRFLQVKELQRQGLTQRGIARQMRISRWTIKRYFSLDDPPPKARALQTTTKALPFMEYLKQRWAAGQHNRQQLLNEIRQQGFSGSYTSLWRATAKFPHHKLTSPLPSAVLHWSPRQAAWLIVCQPKHCTAEQERNRSILCEHSATARMVYPLAQQFGQIVRQGLPEEFETWLKRVEESKLPELKRFAASLQTDYAAVKAAFTFPWSNGQVEGQINRLKLIKRQMYGRASFQLLRRRVLGPPAPP